MARLTTLCPMFNSSMASIPATGITLAYVNPCPACTASPIGGRVIGGRTEFVKSIVIFPPAMSVSSGVQLDCGHAQVFRRVDCCKVGVDEERHMDSGLVEATDSGPERGVAMSEVESALGRDLFATFRHEGHLERPEVARDGDDLFAGGQLEVADVVTPRAMATTSASWM